MMAYILFLFVLVYVSVLLFVTIKKIVFEGEWEFIIFFMILFLPFYISILSIVYQATGSEIVVAVFQYVKELLLLTAVLGFLFYQKNFWLYPFRLNVVDKLFMAFFALATVYLFLPLGEATFLNKLLYLKNTLLIGAFYFLGRNTNFDSGKIDQVFSWIMVIAIAAFCLNVVEKVIGIHFQNLTGYALFNFAINGIEPSGNYGLSWTFETQTTSMRLASFFSDPLEMASSSLLAFTTGLIWYLSRKREESWFYLVVMAAALGSLFFSASRAAFGAFFVMLFFIALVFRLYRLLALGAITLLFFFVYVLYFASDDFYYFVYDTLTFQNASSVGHLVEWFLALDAMIANPEGLGLAMSGNTGSVEDEVRVGGENQFLIYGVQLGVLGMILYILVLGVGIYKSLLVFRHSKDTSVARVAFVAATTKFGLLLPLFTANAELYAYVSLTTWWMMGYSLTAYNGLFRTNASQSVQSTS
ncbi:MAG: O-antigen ligase domain-containing protein [Cyclobacterium sp.]|uniref:O-antigen ligase domain-containing protein n=1 Tax=unclassified Cyclobacterium TaxID=2615055 RepID=UPI00293BA8D3|nr:O-antigen ligase domain-containing protein [Cyclobacterium sp. SYSU L10401]